MVAPVLYSPLCVGRAFNAFLYFLVGQPGKIHIHLEAELFALVRHEHNIQSVLLLQGRKCLKGELKVII